MELWHRLRMQLTQIISKTQWVVSIETEVLSFSFKLQNSAPWVAGDVPRGEGWVALTEVYQHPYSGKDSQCFEEKSPKSGWLLESWKAGICLTPFTKIASEMQKIYFKAKHFCFWKKKRRRGDREMTRNFTKQGWHLPCEPEQAKWNISLHLEKIFAFCLSAAKRQQVHANEKRLAQHQPIYKIIWRNLDVECWNGERNPWDPTDSSWVQSYLRNTHRLNSLYHSNKKIELSVERRVQGLIVLQI